jgi:hypothetical protein
MSDSKGKYFFLIGHIPIFMVVVAFVASLDKKIRSRARNIFCGFLVVHTLLHYAFSENPAYEFTSLISLGLIYGAGLCGVLYFLAAYYKYNENTV